MITSGRKDGCKDGLGGVSNVYLMDYVKYNKKLIQTNTERTKLLSFPITIIYDLELRTPTNFDQSINIEKGQISYKQTIEIAIKKDSLQTFRELNILIKKDLRLIVKDRLGKYQILGLYNGLKATGYKRVTGGAKSDFNGYNITFEADESEISPFIDNLDYTGFIPPIEEGKSLFTADNNVITADNNIISIDIITI